MTAHTVEFLTVQVFADGAGFIMVTRQTIDRDAELSDLFAHLLVGSFTTVLCQVATGNHQVKGIMLLRQLYNLVKALSGIESQQPAIGVGIEVGISDLGYA